MMPRKIKQFTTFINANQARQELEDKGLIGYGLYHSRRFLEMIFSKMVEMKAPLFSRIDRWFFSLSRKRLLMFMDKEKCLKDILFTCENYSGYWYYKDIRAWQIPSEIKALLEEVKKNGASIILDIGTFNGGTLYLWTRFLEAQRIITIDLPFPFGYPSAKRNLFKLFALDKELYFLLGRSYSDETIKKVSHILKNDKLDFIFVDGDHNYEGVKKDFELYRPFVREGGIIAFHDIISPRFGASEFWNEIKHKYPSKEIIASAQEMHSHARSYLDSQGWGGIGVIYF